MRISGVKMAESFLDTCWDVNDKEVASNGSDAHVYKEYQKPLGDKNSPFFAILVQYVIFSIVKAFPLKDIFGCSHCPIHPHNGTAFRRLVVEQSTQFYTPFVERTRYAFTKKYGLL